MKSPNHVRIPLPELTSSAKSPSKLAHSSTPDRSQNRRKRKRNEQETLKPDSPRCFAGADSFHCLRSSSRRCRRRSGTEQRTRAERYRRWAYSSRDSSSFKDKVVVVSYNILGVENASKHPDLYFKVPQRFMEWNRRKKLIRKEINRYNTSILCLQEVDNFDDLNDLFRKDGFKGVYKARTGEAYDGCAIFWKEDLFTLLHQENIEFQSFGLRNNVAQLCVLKMKPNQSELDEHPQTMLPPTQSRSFVIGNIHVLFNPNRGDIKLGQVRLLLEKASKLSQEWGSIPVILCGDINSIPQSPIYQFLASSRLDVQLHDRRNISGQVEFQSKCRVFRSQDEKASSCSIRTSISRPLFHRWSDEELRLATGSGEVTYLQHHLKLCSAYHGVPASCRTRDDFGEPVATSFHSKFMGTVDYIWHTEEFVPVKVLETLPVDILKRTGGLPSKKWGSDHLALVCELAFVDNCCGDSPL
ncbi:carbon catabolite repressor protein 4 homolog 5 isoform X1 [Morus notabilis]|uniref:carbon catabolite repressor protein 4 homolog 5 isoform X1 n=1 Tax=Morus notabilis TaxID=981085 RepID=UPI000CECFB33|nr:carbon catabolite repressor protein 4 homolog 5 isoform X1 [Morus notabilis]